MSAIYDRQASNLEKAKAKELSNEKLTADQRTAIEDKYAKKVNEIKRKQAIADKAAALFSIALNTAIAAMKVAGQTGVGAALAVPLVLALGALQAATVLARPLPAYKDGVRNAPKGLALVGEAGSELLHKNGSVQLIDQPSLINLSGGEDIYKHSDTMRIMGAAKLSSTGYDSAELKQTIVASNEKLIQAIKNKKELHVSMDGKKIIEKEGNYYTTFVNKKMGWHRK